MKKRLATCLILTLFLLQINTFLIQTNVSASSVVQNAFDLDTLITGDPTLSRTSSLTYATGIYDFDMWDFNGLCDSIGVGYDYDGYCEVIERFFLPLNIRFVGFTGINSWLTHATTPTDSIPFSQGVDTILDACDKYGIAVFFVIPGGQWGASGVPPSWDASVIAAHPELQTYDRDGNLKQPGEKPCYVIDNPLLFEQFKEDLARIYEMYGHHPSWVGFYNGIPGGDHAHYVGSTASNIVNTGYHPDTMRNYANSKYFREVVDINTGLHYEDGSPSKLYDTFVASKSFMSYGYGMLQEVGGIEVYQGSSGYAVYVKFKAPENLNGFKAVWYGGKYSGAPPSQPLGSLKATLYPNQGPYDQNFPDFANPMESISDVQVVGENTVDWQPAISFTSTIAKSDYYWIVFTAEGGDSNNFYDVHRRRYQVDPGDGQVLRYEVSGWYYAGSPILKIQDLNGVDKLVMPYQEYGWAVNSNNVNQYFTPEEDLTVNYVWLMITDRVYDDLPHPVHIIRESDGAILASGYIDQEIMHGIYKWIPVRLDQRITLSAGTKYILRIEGAPLNPSDPQGITNPWTLHPLNTDPIELGFQGGVDQPVWGGTYSRTLGFKLADMDLPIANFGYTGPWRPSGWEHSRPAISTATWYATRFKPTVTAQLQSIEVFIYKEGSPGDLIVELWEGDDQPTVKKESKQVSVTGDGYVMLTGWSTTVNANVRYWLIFKSASGEGYRLRRSPNPYLFGLWYTTDGVNWQPPDVGDPSLVVQTTQERLAGTDDLSDDIFLKKSTPVAQSVTPTSDIVAKGIFFFMYVSGNNPATDIIVEIRSDAGGEPSDTVLASGVSTGSMFDRQSMNSLNYADLDFPVELKAGTKYWIVIYSEEEDYAPRINFFYCKYPEDSFGGVNDKALRFSNGVWGQPTSKTFGQTGGDIYFAIAEPPFPTTTYSIPELAEEIETYHYKDNRNEPLEGWNTYLNLWCTRHLKNLLEWFEGYTGKRWIGLDVNEYGMVQEVEGEDYLYTYRAVTGPLPNQGPPSYGELRDDCLRKVRELLIHGGTGLYSEGALGHNQDNTGAITSEQIGYYYRFTVPLLARGIHAFDVDAPHLANDTQQQWSRFYGDILSRMRYYGGYFGNEKSAVKALFLGDQDIGITPQFLTPAIDIKMEGFMGFSGDYNLTKYGDFKQFDVIVGFSGRPSLSQLSTDAQERIKDFVSDGGGLVCFGGYPSWASEIFADSETIPVDHIINSPYTESDFVDSRPEISVSSYGLGRGVVVQLKRSWWKVGTDPDIPGAPRDSILVLVTNSLFYAGDKESFIPAWWYPQYRDFQPWHEEVWYSICGKPGSPVLLWLSNDGESTEFEIHLNAMFYGIDSSGWLAIDVQNWEVVAKGSGTDIKIDTTIPAESWKPIYIMNATSDLQALYSNIFLLDESTDTNAATYVLEGPYKQTSWLLVTSTRQPVSVSANNTGSLQEYSLEDLSSSSTLEGWYYDSTNEILYIKFHTTSPVNVEISLTVIPEFPTWMPFLITFAAVTVLVVLAKRKLKRSFLWKKK